MNPNSTYIIFLKIIIEGYLNFKSSIAIFIISLVYFDINYRILFRLNDNFFDNVVTSKFVGFRVRLAVISRTNRKEVLLKLLIEIIYD